MLGNQQLLVAVFRPQQLTPADDKHQLIQLGFLDAAIAIPGQHNPLDLAAYPHGDASSHANRAALARLPNSPHKSPSAVLELNLVGQI